MNPTPEHLLAQISDEETRLAALERQREEASARLTVLREQLATSSNGAVGFQLPLAVSATAPANPLEKVRLFRSLFRGREDVFPTRFESKKTGRPGYAPACANKFIRGVCELPKIKCGDCPNQAFLPVGERAVLDHLRGRHVMGVYPLLEDETCWFLAADFDRASWQDDIAAVVETCRSLAVPVAVERSRSGNGAHAWFFFTALVPARIARNMGCYLITETMARRHQLDMDSYDRLFPNQDTLPRGGFGNLIALPLQYHARREGKTVFLDDTLDPYADQWAFLASVPRMDPAAVEAIAREATQRGQVVGVRLPDLADDELASPWSHPPSGLPARAPIPGPLPKPMRAVLSQRLFVEKSGLPSALLNQIQRLAAFQNPEFYKKQSMRLSTATTPRVVACAEDFPQHIALPRGCRGDLEELCAEHGIELVIDDQRHAGDEACFRVDECHHVPAVSFERVLSEVKARYVVGLTATPLRRDGHQPILEMQLGPARFTVDRKNPAARRPFEHELVVRETAFRLDSAASEMGIQEIYRALAADEVRNRLILDDVIRSIADGRSPVLLTERRDHLEYFAERLRGFVRHVIVLRGGMTAKERGELAAKLAGIRDGEERLVLATGRYIGEGFDDARLDTLFLALPISWKGTLVQYTGRLHRLHPGKTTVRIFDYVDREVPVLLRMFERRLRAYRAIGYARGDAPLGFAQPVEELTIEYDDEALRHFHASDSTDTRLTPELRNCRFLK